MKEITYEKTLLEEIGEKVKKINFEADLATGRLLAVEDSLKSFGLGSDVWIAVTGWKFGFSKVDGNWGLFIETGFINRCHVRNAPRRFRIAAARHIRELLVAIEKSVDVELDAIQVKE